MTEQISKRQEANLKIADILINNTVWELEYGYGTLFREYAYKHPQQRAGQIICNYICTDYRCQNPSIETTAFLEDLFPNNPDPFFEESVVTLKRLKNYYSK